MLQLMDQKIPGPPLGDTVPAKPQHLRKYTFSKFSRPPNIKVVWEVFLPYRFLFNFGNSKQLLHAINVFKNKIFFLSKPVPFTGQNYQNQMGPGTSDQSLFRLRNKFRKNPDHN